MSHEDYTEKWLELFKMALNLLNHKRFEKFVFGVGIWGTDEERCRKAEAVMEMLRPKVSNEVMLNVKKRER